MGIGSHRNKERTMQEILDELIEKHGCNVGNKHLASELASHYKIQMDEAERLVEKYSEYIDMKRNEAQGVTQMQDTNDNNYEGSIEIYNIDIESGEETTEDYYGLPVLRAKNHPLVPELGHSYIPRELDGSRTDISVAARCLADPNFPSLYIGETGVGKNVLLKHLCEQTNRPLVRVNFGINTTYEKLIGLYVPDEKNGGFTWRDGVLTKAVRYGWVFDADEINAAPPEVTVELNGLAEDAEARELFIQEKNELVKPHPNFRLVGTMNPSYAGTKDMNKAFKGRFYPLIIPHLPFNENSPEDSPEVGIIMEKSNLGAHAEGKKIAGRLVTLAHKLRQQADFETGQTLTTPISTRQLIQTGNLVCDENGDDFMSPKAAARIVFRGFADPFEWTTVDTTIDRHFPKSA